MNKEKKMSNVSKFEELLKFNINDKVEKKRSGNTELTYLSWAFAVGEMEKAYPEWEYSILEFNGLPYQFDPNTGYLVWTEIKAGGKTKRMWLPVMDGANKSMKDKSYQYKTKYDTKHVEAASMFDINKTIMRCLVKNIAMFGLGLYIYAGEDLPEGEEEQSRPDKKQLQALADGIQEDYKINNEENFKMLKKLFEGTGSKAELDAEIAKHKKLINGLAKYAPELFKFLQGCKEAMLESFGE